MGSSIVGHELQVGTQIPECFCHSRFRREENFDLLTVLFNIGDRAKQRNISNIDNVILTFNTVIQKFPQKGKCYPQNKPQYQPYQYNELSFRFDRGFRIKCRIYHSVFGNSSGFKDRSF